jgi:hypothetical protein
VILPCRFLPRSIAAVTLWPFILIQPARKTDAALIEHEMVHYRRQAARPYWWGIPYLLSREFRFTEEVLGYRAQIAEGGITAPAAAIAISTKYHTGRSYEECYAALTA